MDINTEKRAYTDWYCYTHELYMSDEEKAEKHRKEQWEKETALKIVEILERTKDELRKRPH
jgi:hypothetical protein